MAIDAVLFDLMGTLVGYPTSSWRIKRALTACGRQADDATVAGLLAPLVDAYHSTEIQRMLETEDCTVENHVATNMLMLERAGYDGELAEAYYEALADLEGHPWLPGALDTVEEAARRGAKIVIISDIHFDVRPGNVSLARRKAPCPERVSGSFVLPMFKPPLAAPRPAEPRNKW